MFIVLEGIDGSGKETQAGHLLAKLREEKVDFYYKHYPEANKPIGELIYGFLRKKYALPPLSLTLLYVADFVKDAEDISRQRKERIVLANRYFTSTLAYEWALGVDIDTLIKLGDILPIPKPDVVILLDVSPEEAVRRKRATKDLDRFEGEISFLQKVRENYLYLSENGVFCNRWVIIDGNRDPETVFSELWAIFSALL